MKVAVVQSAHLPWLGYFDLIDKSDVFVFFDNVQWTKRDWRNRNRIRTPQGWLWLTVPVKLEKPHDQYRICEVRIDYSQEWVDKHLSTIKAFYTHAPFFQDIFSIIERRLLEKPEYLVDLNYGLIGDFCSYLGIAKKFLYAQNLNISPERHKTDLILAILQRVPGTDQYLSGQVAKNYLDEALLNSHSIKVAWHNYTPSFYLQNRWRTPFFISHLSIIDLLFHHGKESLSIIRKDLEIQQPQEVIVCTPEEFNKSRGLP